MIRHLTKAQIRAQYPTLDALAELITAHSERKLDEMGIDMAELPTYGGADISDPMECWSWDATRVLYGSGHEIAIISRASLAAQRGRPV